MATLAPIGRTEFEFSSGVKDQVKTILAGSEDWMYDRLPSRFFSIPAASNEAGDRHIRVVSNGVVAFESAPHFLSFKEPRPEIHSLAPTAVVPGDRITISGINLEVPLSDLKISFGISPYENFCTELETFKDGKTINCKIPTTTLGGIHLVTVDLGARGKIRDIHEDHQHDENSTVLFLDVSWEISKVRLPSSMAGSQFGGTMVKIASRPSPPTTPSP